jgi:exoribonuclease-2
MERYWVLRYLEQEGITSIKANTIKENLVRFERLPYVTRVFGMPEMPPGTPVEVALGAIDLLELDARCTFVAAPVTDSAA